jgi:hypothetical protein
MSYHRGEPYVWADDVDMHLWSKVRDRNDGEYVSGVRIELPVFDEIVRERWVDLADESDLPANLKQAATEINERMRLASRKGRKG